MLVIQRLKDLKKISIPVILTAGNFDGIHEGHKRIIKFTVKEAQKRGCGSCVLTFRQHPAIVLGKKPSLLLMEPEEKINHFRKAGLDYVVVLPFTRRLAERTAEEFLTILCDSLRIRKICVGLNFAFGNKGAGGPDLLKEKSRKFGYELKIFSVLKSGKEPVSSTRIRAMILKGKIRNANRLSGHPYCISSEAISGKQLGRTIGYPTINFSIRSIKKILPPEGVYAVMVHSGKRMWPGLTYIGPAHAQRKRKKIFETWVNGKRIDGYGKIFTVCFLQYIRPPRTLTGLTDLKKQIDQDKAVLAKMIKGGYVPWQ